MLQAFGSSSGIAIGAGVVGDVATPAEQGSYFGLFSMGQMLGTVIGPLLGGVISQYLSWRWIFWIFLIIGSVFFLVILFFLPETLRSPVGDGSGHANPTPYQWHKHHTKEREAYTDDDSSTIARLEKQSRFLQVPNVTQPFSFLFEKDVIIALVYNGIHYATYYCDLTSTSSQFAFIYNLSEIQIGLCFLCQGVRMCFGFLC
jgi:MFS family permease